VNMLRRPVRLIAPGIYTTFDGEYRIENIRVASGDLDQESKWALYLQHEPGVTPDTLDQRASFISDHDTLDDAIQSLAHIKGENHVSACFKECPVVPVKARDLRPGQLVDLEEDAIADPLLDHRRYEWEFMEVMEAVPETDACIRVEFDGVSIRFPADHVLAVLNDERPERPGPQPT
jgi:hypothetical protein